MEAIAALAAPPPPSDTIHPIWFPPADQAQSRLSDQIIIALGHAMPDVSPLTVAAAMREAADQLDPATALERSALWGGARDIATLADALNESLSTLKAIRDAADCVWDGLQTGSGTASEEALLALEGALELADEALSAAGIDLDDNVPVRAPIGAETELGGSAAA